MRQPQHNTTRLPRQLLQELSHDFGKRDRRPGKDEWRKSGPTGRRERRKLEREGKRQAMRRRFFRPSRPEKFPEDEESDIDEDNVSENDDETSDLSQNPASSVFKDRTNTPIADDPPPLKGILKKRPAPISGDEAVEDRGKTPPLVLRPSKALQEKFEQDDREIKALEKALRVKGKTLPKSFANDGLGELLDGLDSGNNTDEDARLIKKRKRDSEDDQWLRNKRRLAEAEERCRERDEMQEVSDTEFDAADVADGTGDQENQKEDAGSESSFSGFGSETPSPQSRTKKIRENPYIAPVAPSQAKYIPPSLRRPSASETEELQRLRRRTQGLLNRLSEASLLTVVTDVEELYSSHPRRHVTSTLCAILTDLICDKTSLNDTFIILHAGFITAMYRVVGPDFGAEVLAHVVSKFDTLFSSSDILMTSKAPLNLISLICKLYVFSLTTSHLVFGYTRQFLTTLSESHTEFLLKIVMSCGPQLRQSDPGSLKSIVSLLQPAIASAGGESNLSVRTKFMIETITALKNNRMKTGAAASALTSEHTTRMKKTLGSLNNGARNIRASEPLNLSLDDIRKLEKRGKWWLVGSSWHPNKEGSLETNTNITDEAASIHQLAVSNHMITPVRNLLFSTVITSPDYNMAAQTLFSLPLKRNTFRSEMPRVLLQCVGSEDVYNPFYALVTRRLYEMDRRIRMGLLFALWDLLKRIAENEEERDDDGGGGDDDLASSGGAISMRKIVNTAKYVSALLLFRILSLGEVLRQSEDLRYLAPGGNSATFIEVLLLTVLVDAGGKSKSKSKSESQSKSTSTSSQQLGGGGDGKNDRETVLTSLFTLLRGKDAGLRPGLRWFVEKIVKKSDLVSSSGSSGVRKSKEWKKVKEGCKIAVQTLTRLSEEVEEEEEKDYGDGNDVEDEDDMDAVGTEDEFEESAGW